MSFRQFIFALAQLFESRMVHLGYITFIWETPSPLREKNYLVSFLLHWTNSTFPNDLRGSFLDQIVTFSISSILLPREKSWFYPLDKYSVLQGAGFAPLLASLWTDTRSTFLPWNGPKRQWWTFTTANSDYLPFALMSNTFWPMMALLRIPPPRRFLKIPDWVWSSTYLFNLSFNLSLAGLMIVGVNGSCLRKYCSWRSGEIV